jgi:hypothetical protein
MNHFFITCLISGLLLFIGSSTLEAQEKCGKNTTSTTVAANEPYQPKNVYHIPKTDRPLISEQTQLTTKQSKRQRKRLQQWQRRQRHRKKGCPAAKF